MATYTKSRQIKKYPRRNRKNSRQKKEKHGIIKKTHAKIRELFWEIKNFYIWGGNFFMLRDLEHNIIFK